jgi:predicted branched-subunit amino acid permease
LLKGVISLKSFSRAAFCLQSAWAIVTLIGCIVGYLISYLADIGLMAWLIAGLVYVGEGLALRGIY